MKQTAHKPPGILTINGGSSSIKFALFECGGSFRRILEGALERIGLAEATLRVKGLDPKDNVSRSVSAPDHAAALNILMDGIAERVASDDSTLAAVGHRVVHGGPTYSRPERIDAAMIEELRRLSPLDPEHLPAEILLIEAFQERFPDLPQVACFDTAFHHELPRVARLLPIPRRYEALGVRRYGFHGLSYAFLMGELARLAGTEAARGRIILAHLGNGASLAAVRDGKPLDTSMGFTPTAGVPMSTRSGDLDPGLGGVSGAHGAHERGPIQRDGEFPIRSARPVGNQFGHARSARARNRATRGRPKRSRSSAIRSRNGSAPSRRRWADWTRWSSPAASARTRPRSAPALATDWASWASTSTRGATRRMRA